MTAVQEARSPQQRRDDRAVRDRSQDRGGELRSILLTVGLFAVMVVVVIGILLSQFGTVRDASSPIASRDEPVGGASGFGGDWDAIRGEWAVGPDGARVSEAGPQLSVAVRPVGGVDGEVVVDGTFGGDGWGVVVRWSGPGTYAVVVVEPDEGTISLVAVVSDRSRLLGTAALPPGEGDADGVRSVAVTLAGPVMDVRVDGVLAVAGRDDDLTDGTHAGVAVVGDQPDARFTRFRSGPPGAAGTRMITPEEGGP